MESQGSPSELAKTLGMDTVVAAMWGLRLQIVYFAELFAT